MDINNSFDILPYVGAHPLYFGMSPEQVTHAVGEPKLKTKVWTGGLEFDYEAYNVAFSLKDITAVEIGFTRFAAVTYKGVNLFVERKHYIELIKEDGSAMEYVGFIYLLNLGIVLSGFHDEDESQLAIRVFSRGSQDAYLSKMKPYRV